MRAAPALPKRVWIGTSEVKISIVPHDDPQLDGGETRGTTICELPPKVHISDALDPGSMLEVVWHELTHVINWLAELGDESTEEQVADVHGRAWPALLIANPKLQRWFTHQINAIRKEQSNA